MRPVIDVALRFGPKLREQIVYRRSREWVMTAEDPREAARLERAEAERLALYVAQQSPDLGRAAFALSAAARYLAGNRRCAARAKRLALAGQRADGIRARSVWPTDGAPEVGASTPLPLPR
jgi:hypothetical protein